MIMIISSDLELFLFYFPFFPLNISFTKSHLAVEPKWVIWTF